MDIYKEFRLEFDVEKLVRFVLSTSESGVTEHEIVAAIKRKHRDFIELP
jgi:hypothetical protein